MHFSALRVLLIEDDPVIQEYLSKLLSNHGAKIVGRAGSGTKALDLLASSTPEFVICDIHLGQGLTGIDIAKVINKKYAIPFIFLTSFDDEDTLDEALIHSPYGYIVKPFHDRSLISTIKTALNNHTKKNSVHKLNRVNVEELIGASLSDQEFSILQLLLDGSSYQDIADVHFLSRDSIKYHAGKLYAKLGVKSRGALAGRLM